MIEDDFDNNEMSGTIEGSKGPSVETEGQPQSDATPDIDAESETESGAADIAEDDTGTAISAIEASECLSCGGVVAGVFCSSCGQKQDDLRRSLRLLARDFIEDTFAFDSRMWRTLGSLAMSPGVVPTEFSHGRRSQFTPPIRLFLVISFLFFLTIGFTNTLFVGLEVRFLSPEALAETTQEDTIQPDEPSQGGINFNVEADLDETGEESCAFQGNLRFFIDERDLTTDKERLDYCIQQTRETIRKELVENDEVTIQIGADEGDEAERAQADALVARIIEGVRWGIENPKQFNAAINNWLPRVLLLMTPILALILSLYLRRDALLFDHMVLSLYVHSVNFLIVGSALLLTQLGIPFAGYVAALAISIYYIAALKRAYNRGWVKTIWTALSSGLVYLLVFFVILLSIMSRVLWGIAA